MSAQCGIWNFKAEFDRNVLVNLIRSIEEYGPDGCDSYIAPRLGMGYSAFNTTPESRFEKQPYQSADGIVLTWDGRLDNGEEIIREFDDQHSEGRTDAAIVVAAYQKWGSGCFRKLVGDWALSLWDPRQNTLFLAKDFIGPRHLYYCLTEDGIAWSTVLASLLPLTKHPATLHEAYFVGYFALYPPAHLTPYSGVRAVPAGAFIEVKDQRLVIHQYWRFDPAKKLVYQRDSDYEEHFREVFATAVRRRLRSNAPVLAELSGGMDSSSIVCMADQLLKTSCAPATRLDTISYYDDEEPNWDERPYFSVVEARRGKAGTHLNVSGGFTFDPPPDPTYFSPIPPGMDRSGFILAARRIQYMQENGNRVLLSGIGGDEFLGGVPTPISELADLFRRGQLFTLLRRTKMWSLARKQPWLHLLVATIRNFFPTGTATLAEKGRIPPWLKKSLLERQKEVLAHLMARTKWYPPRPSFQASCGAVETLRRQLAAMPPQYGGNYEVRYPYLDRDLLEFIFSIPREQLVRPGRRRSLMRRALAGIVPSEILERRRKAFVARAPIAAIQDSWAQIASLTAEMISDSLGFLDRPVFVEALHAARSGHEAPILLILHTLRLELWLRNAFSRGILAGQQQSYALFSSGAGISTPPRVA